ncbi:hypothetical protein MMC14_006343 [Varicellaria rhodocarpa]|nr:hypothetical protein [Varicellaria rhodocarpa]
MFYLLSRFEELGIAVGPMNVRLENLNSDISPGNYVSFLGESQRSKGRSDRDSIHSVSSVRSVMSGMSGLWSSFGIGSSTTAAKTERARAQSQADLKYLYSAFTKIPCLRLSPDRKARLIRGFEEFPFDTAVPLLSFKNISALEVCDIDFRQFFGWDKLAEQLRSLTVKRANVDDPTDLLIGIVLDDMDKRRRRSSKIQVSPSTPYPPSPSPRYSEFGRPVSTPASPVVDSKLARSSSPQNVLRSRGDLDISKSQQQSRTDSTSPSRPTSSRQDSSYRHTRGPSNKIKRSGSSSSTSSTRSAVPPRTRSSSNLLSIGILPASKWRFLKHLSLADNGLTSLSASSFTPLANTLHSLDLSSNLFSEVPDCLANLMALRALNLSNCMMESLHSLARSLLPAITALNLRANRLVSIAGVERLLSLERLDLRDNRLNDPTELARLTGIPDMREIWVLSNPFIRTHANYRITIFNLFRATPGYTEDIFVDATGPGYHERRQLRDRVGEVEGIPVIKSYAIDWGLTGDGNSQLSSRDPHIPLQKSSIEEHARPIIQSTQSEVAVGSSRRKKGTRRRIVDLSVDESQAMTHTRVLPEIPSRKAHVAFTNVRSSSAIEADKPADTVGAVISSYEPNCTTASQQGEPRNFNLTSALGYDQQISEAEARGLAIADELQSLNLNGEAYRRKVEALKGEFGSSWLSVLSEDNWNNRETSETQSTFSRVTGIRPEVSNLRASSQEITSGGRTFG